nr:DNA-processing protein DprA [Empedobacter brevis]
MQTDLPYILALSFQKGIGDVTARKIIQFFGSAETAWNCKPKDLMQISGIGWQMSKDFGNKKWLDLALTEIEFCKNNQINVLTFYDQDYPLLLKECIDAPLVIFCKGNLNFNQFNHKKIAIVGTRKMTNYGRIFITELIEGLSDFDVTIVSGLAYGCDVEAHNNAVKKNLKLGRLWEQIWNEFIRHPIKK